MLVLADSDIDWLQHLVIVNEEYWFAGGGGEVLAPLLVLLQRQTQLKLLAMYENEDFSEEQE